MTASYHRVLQFLDRVAGGKFAGRSFAVFGSGLDPDDLKVRDGGPALTREELAAMLAEVKAHGAEWEAEQLFSVTERDKLMVKVLADLENRLAVLEGKEEISEADYVKHLAATLTEMRGA